MTWRRIVTMELTNKGIVVCICINHNKLLPPFQRVYISHACLFYRQNALRLVLQLWTRQLRFWGCTSVSKYNLKSFTLSQIEILIYLFSTGRYWNGHVTAAQHQQTKLAQILTTHVVHQSTTLLLLWPYPLYFQQEWITLYLNV